MAKQLYKFNPSLATAQVLQETLIGREAELLRILKKIEECAQGTSLRHFLVIGPRGIGKTHFILLIYHTVKGHIAWDSKFNDLNRFWIPIRFAEEEYRVATLGEFLFRILEELKKEAPGVAEILPMTNFKISRGEGQAETEKLLSALFQSREKLGRRMLLLVDNFHEILGRFTAADQGRLRDILMSKDLFLLIGTAPTLFEQITSYEESFYNFFENIWLGELSAEEAANLIYKWWQQDKRQDSQAQFEELRPRINALIHLTGGNPRLILGLYSIITEANISEVEATFIALLDELTPYFQFRMKELSQQQAKILDAMALMEGPSSPTHIASQANLEVRIVTSQLKRMHTSGYVNVLKERGKRGVLYDVKERLFRLWRQMRVEAGGRYLKFLVTVLKVWYSEEELKKQFEKVSSELRFALEQKREEEAKEALKHLWYIEKASPSYLYPEISRSRISGLIEIRDFGVAEAELQLFLQKAEETQDNDKMADGYKLKAYLHHKMGKNEKAIESLKRCSELGSDGEEAWYIMGNTYDELGRHKEAIEAYQKATEIKPDKHEAWYNMGSAYAKLGHHEEAIEAYRKAAALKPGMHEAWGNSGDAYNELKRHQEAIEAYTKAIELAFSESLYQVLYRLNRSLVFVEIEKYARALHDAEEACKMAQETMQREQETELKGTVQRTITVAATVATFVSLHLSRRAASHGKLELGEKHLRKSLLYAQLVPADRLQEHMTDYFTDLLRKKRVEFLARALEIVEQAKFPDMEQLLRFYRIAVQYLETKDKSVLNELFPELRELVESLDK